MAVAELPPRGARSEGRVPPHNLDAEESLLGAMLLSRDAIVAATEVGLGADEFYKPAYGHIFDHFSVEYEYEGGVKVSSMARQQDGTDARVSEWIVGTKGVADPAGTIKGENAFRFKRPEGSPTPYQQEHIDLIASIRKNEPLNEAKRIAESTLTAIMGRMSAYTGKEVTWEQAMESNESLMPSKRELGPIATPPVAMPGRTHLT